MALHLAFLVAAFAAARAADKGYVVRVDSDAVWTDLTAADGAAPGRTFEIYAEGAELKHPVTGEVLGRARESVADGTITDVSDKFSAGRITARKGDAKAGQRVRLAAALAPARPAADSKPGGSAERASKTRGAMLDYPVNAMAVGDFGGTGKPQVALASENAIKLYAYPVLDAKPLAETTVPGTALRILGLDAARLDGDAKDALFVSVFDDAFKRFETRVYKVETGKWLKVADLPFLTRAYQDGAGARALATQQVIDDKSFPFGKIYPLAYRDGKYAQGRPPLAYRRLDWLYGFTTARLGEGDAALLYLTPVHALRVQLGKNWWRTPDDDYGQTPVRVRWQDRLLEFHPPMPVAYGPSGFEALYAARNMAAVGGLASPFGIFNRGEVARKAWNGLALETVWKADLPGCAQGLSIVEPEPGRRELAVAIRGAAEQSSVWTFDL